MNIPKELNQRKEPLATCSHTWHVDKPKYLHQSNTQSVKIWVRYNTLDMNTRQLCNKISKKHNKTKRRPMTCSYIWYIKISNLCVLNRYIFCECLVELYATKHKCRSLLSYFFSDIGQCCRPAQKTVSKVKTRTA